MIWTDENKDRLRAMIESGKTLSECAAAFETTKATISTAAKRNKLGAFPRLSGPQLDKQRPIPSDFVERYRELGTVRCQAHYGAGSRVMTRWIDAAGVRQPVVPKGAPKSKEKPKAGVATGWSLTMGRDGYRKDDAPAGQAADYLRHFGPVVRCDFAGKYHESGDYYRVGNLVLCPSEIIQRAHEKRQRMARMAARAV